MKKKIYKVVIIGLGKSGLLYDLKKNNFFSHSQAITKNKRLKLVAGVDIDKKKTQIFKNRFNSKVYSSLKDLIKNQYFDIVVISVPTDKQYKVINDLIKLTKNKTILCEKPCTNNLNEIINIYKKSNKRKIDLFVNFQRISLKSSEKIDKILKQEKKVVINVTYSQGVLNSASHYISLFLHFFSNKNIKLIKYKNYKTHIKNDFLSEFTIIFKNYKINFKPKINYKKIHGAFKTIGQKFNIRYLSGGKTIIIRNNISGKIRCLKTDIQNSQLAIYNQLIKKLDGKKSTLCSIDNAIETFKIIDKIK